MSKKGTAFYTKINIHISILGQSKTMLISIS